ncbi:hypothetical protein KI387_012201, partial [Taxus chinensis]
YSLHVLSMYIYIGYLQAQDSTGRRLQFLDLEPSVWLKVVICSFRIQGPDTYFC